MSSFRVELFVASPYDGPSIGGQTGDVAASPTIVTPAIPASLVSYTLPKDRIGIAVISTEADPIWVAVGTNPDASHEPRRLVRSGRKSALRFAPSERLAVLAATDVPAGPAALVPPPLDWGPEVPLDDRRTVPPPYP